MPKNTNILMVRHAEKLGDTRRGITKAGGKKHPGKVRMGTLSKLDVDGF